MKTILVVDDQLYIRRLIQTKLQQRGYTVRLAEDGKEAVDKARAESPDLIIMDIMMPAMDGSEAAEHIRADATTAHIPIIFLTELVKKEEEAISGHMIGGNYFIAKPFRAEELVGLVGKILDGQE